MCKYCLVEYTQCGCLLRTFDPCPRASMHKRILNYHTFIYDMCDQCKERQANPPEPGLDLGQQGFKTPSPQPESPTPEPQPETHVKTWHVCGQRVGEYDLTKRTTVLTQSQRDALASAGHGNINKITVTSRRELNVTRRRSPLTEEQSDALRAGGHGNVSHIVTKRRRTSRDDSASSDETRHTLSERQRAALREAGHGNLRTIVVKKGSRSKTPSN